jgi:hypothetical protein
MSQKGQSVSDACNKRHFPATLCDVLDLCVANKLPA